MATRSETFRFDVSCPCDRYTPFRFFWLNRRGGYDGYTFRLRSTRTVRIGTKDYDRYLSRASADGTRYGYAGPDRGRTVYSVEAFDVRTVVSTWETEGVHSWLEEMFTSPDVYWAQRSSSQKSTYYWKPVVLTNTEVEVRNKEGFGNRLLSHVVEFVEALPKVIQNR